MSIQTRRAVAHIRETTGEVQTVKQHCEETAALASSFAIEAMKPVVNAAGILHDVGKYQPAFQRRIYDHTTYAPHAPCGAQAAKDSYPPGCARLMIAYTVAGHHAGLPDYGSKSDVESDSTLWGNWRRKTDDFQAYHTELSAPPVDETALQNLIVQDCSSPEDCAEKFAFLTRYCFSCLTDADSLNTEEFCTGQKRETLPADFAACLNRVNERLRSFQAVTPLQKARAGLQQQAFSQVETPAEIYLMNMPTGSGKTLCSLKFALERALRSGKKRLIYVIPYNSIIDQTAETFEELLGDSATLLRHQSTWVYEEDSSLDTEEKLARTKATENWDAPIIITTAVQFFQSLYGNRRSGLRKMHNMADAVLVFDEAHLLPRAYLQPCLRGIAYLARYMQSEVILLTATMPDYRTLLNRYGVAELRTVELVPDRRDFGAFAKCAYRMLGMVSDEALLAYAQNAPSCLIIVNSRKVARTLYAACGTARKYHLSTWMTVLDRQRVIAEVRAALADLAIRYPNPADVPPEERLVVISTSLVEAGVDVDFHTVLRELTGLDSILQAGGRCNREGKRPMADVYVFEREESGGRPSADARIGITRDLLRSFDPIDTPECIKTYYEKLFAAHEDELKRNAIVPFAKANDCFEEGKPMQLPFRSYAQAFQMIDAPTYAIAVPCDEASRELIRKIPLGLTAPERRKLQKYTCSVNPHDFKQLLDQRLVDMDESGLCWLRSDADYDPRTGIRFESSDRYDR